MSKTLKFALGMIVACALAAFLATTSFAQDGELTGTLKKIQDSGAITLGYREASVPFSYLDTRRRPIGYSIDLCLAIVEEVKAELEQENILVKDVPVTSQNRIAMVVDGTVDLECGSTTNNLARQKEVSFSPVFFVSGTKLLARKAAKLKSYRSLRNRTVVVTEGTTNETAIRVLNKKENLNITIVTAKDHDQAFRMVETGQADAWAGDDVLLYGFVAQAKNPKDFEVLGQYLSYDPYGLMYRKNDPAFGAVVERAFARLAESREITYLYEKWLVRKLPSSKPLGLPMSAQLRSIFVALGMPEEAAGTAE